MTEDVHSDQCATNTHNSTCDFNGFCVWCLGSDLVTPQKEEE